MKNSKVIRRGKLLAVVLSVTLTASFLVLQGLEIKGVDTEQVTLQTTINQTITLDVDSATSNLGSLTPGVPVSSSTVCTVTTNAESGYDLQVKRDDADTTMDKISEAATNIVDKTAWTSGTPNAAVYSGTGLGFSVCLHCH